MKLIKVIDEDFTNYKLPSMFIAFPSCTWKCEKECGVKCCQNSELAKAPSVNIKTELLIERYLNNPITKAVVCGGLEPLDSFQELKEFLEKFRTKSLDTVVIYTGYYPEEVEEILSNLKVFKNIIVKFGRYVPGSESVYDELLGVTLASTNQYSRRI